MSAAADDEADEGTILRPVGSSQRMPDPAAPGESGTAAAPAEPAAPPVPNANPGPRATSDADVTLFPRPSRASAPTPVAPDPAVSDVADPPTWGPVTQSGQPRSSGNALPLRTRIGEFVLTRVIGEGGFGIVYEAHDDSLDRRVAVKEYFPAELAERTANLQVRCMAEEDQEIFHKGLVSFINEAKILARFDHPSLVKVYRFWEANGTAYMVMPYYEGPTLLDALRRLRRPPDEAWLRTLLEPLTEALAVIHDERVYHRDISPDNILLLSGSGVPLLLDFGAARHVIKDANQKAPTAIVKPGYAPIEQYSDVQMSQGPWSDVYALAAVLHFAITGRKPPAAIARLVSDAYVPLSTVAAGRYGSALLAAIDKALIVAPADRTQSMDAFRAALGLEPLARDAAGALIVTGSAPASAFGAVAGDAASPMAGDAGSPQRRAAWRRRSLALAGVAVLAAAAGLGWWAMQGAPTPLVAQAPPAVVPPPPATSPPVTAPPAEPPPVASAPVDAPPPVSPPVTPPAPFSVVSEFARIQAQSTPGHAVGIEWKAGSSFRIGKGDVLAMNITSTHDGFMYVLAYTPDDVLFQYFPNAVSRANQVRRQTIYSVPRSVTDPRTGLLHEGIVLTDPPGKGHVLVIVSKYPRDFGRLGNRRESIYPLYPVGAAAGALHQALAGAAPSIYLGEVQCPPGPPCVDEFGATTESFEILP